MSGLVGDLYPIPLPDLYPNLLWTYTLPLLDLYTTPSGAIRYPSGPIRYPLVDRQTSVKTFAVGNKVNSWVQQLYDFRHRHRLDWTLQVKVLLYWLQIALQVYNTLCLCFFHFCTVNLMHTLPVISLAFLGAISCYTTSKVQFHLNIVGIFHTLTTVVRIVVRQYQWRLLLSSTWNVVRSYLKIRLRN